MRSLIITLLCISFFSCDKNEIDCNDTAFDQSFEAGINDEFCFPDGLTLKIIRIQDMRCPCDVICVWQGYIDLTVYAYKDGQERLLHINNEPDVITQDSLAGYQIDFSEFIVRGNDCAPVPEKKIRAILNISQK